MKEQVKQFGGGRPAAVVPAEITQPARVRDDKAYAKCAMHMKRHGKREVSILSGCQVNRPLP